jgi:hypothetical protein
MGVPNPTFIPEPFANTAASANITFPIPDSPPSSPANAASWSKGFPAITMQPEIAGGEPPLGPDFNGILYTITEALCALQAGQFYSYNGTYATSISGYDKGALLWMTDGTGFWLNTSAGNTTNPDNDSTSANWVPGIAYGKTAITGLIGGSVTLAPSQSKYGLIILSGALTANQTVVLPATIQQWLIVNNCTGAFTVTAKTAAGTGVVIPAGGASSPTGVYGDGTNINLSNSPLSVPIAVPATPNTLCERDNTGQGFFLRMNLSSSPTENPTIGAVLVQNAGLDGYTRWSSFANFKTQLLNIVGALTSSAGWWRGNPDDSIDQGGSFNYPGSGSVYPFTFTVPFTSRVLSVLFTTANGGFTPGWDISATTLTTGYASMGGLGGTPQTIYWRALGV